MFGFDMTSPPSSGYQEGVVDEIVIQGKAWRVRFASSYWPAKSVRPAELMPGDRVRVVGLDNITLLVDPSAAPDGRVKQSV
jgi:membrane protein implicated in regulation of membrane protease activity